MPMNVDAVYAPDLSTRYALPVFLGRLPAGFPSPADDYIEGWAERLEYDGKRNQVELFQKARLKRNNDEIRGDYIFYDGVAETFRVGPAASDGAKSATSSTPGRVRMVIQPKPATGNEPAATSPLPLKSSPLINKPREE